MNNLMLILTLLPTLTYNQCFIGQYELEAAPRSGKQPAETLNGASDANRLWQQLQRSFGSIRAETKLYNSGLDADFAVRS